MFGVACYQQIDAEVSKFYIYVKNHQFQSEYILNCYYSFLQKLTNKTEDVTRSTVQKSVCVLSKFPLYGHIQVAYFFKFAKSKYQRVYHL